MQEAVAKLIETTREDLGAERPEKIRRFRDNAIDGFKHGAVLDLRVRLAMEMLVHNQSIVRAALDLDDNPKEGAAGKVAQFALDATTELLALAGARGLIEPLDSPDAVEHLREHVKRQADFNIEQQRQQLRANEEAARIPKAVGKAFNQ